MALKTVLLATVVLFCTSCRKSKTHISHSSTAKIEFYDLTHDFGTLSSTGSLYHYEYRFKNVGDEPLIINKVESSCGCLIVNESKEPVQPGKQGVISIDFNPKATQYGYVKRYVDVYNNSSNLPFAHLIISGIIKPN